MIIISANTSSNVEILFQVCITMLKRQGRQKCPVNLIMSVGNFVINVINMIIFIMNFVSRT